MRRRWLVAGGGVAVTILAWMADRGYVDGVVPVEPLVAVAGNDYYLVAGFAVLALVLAIPILASGRETELAQTEMPAPERPIQVPAPGDEFDDAVRRRAHALPFLRRGERAAIRDRLRTAAIHAVVRAENCDREDARRAIDAGTWTTDPDAAEFLRRASTGSPSIRDRLAAFGTGETWFYRRVRRTVAATAEKQRRAGGDR